MLEICFFVTLKEKIGQQLSGQQQEHQLGSQIL